MRHPTGAALLARARRPALQDAALACGLFLAWLLTNGGADPVAVGAGRPGGGWDGPGAAGVWWTATALTLAGVALRRRWPVPMLVACALSTTARVTVDVLPTVMDLAVLILLSTVAARCSRPVSLLALGGLLVSAVCLIGGSPLDHSLRIPTLRVCSRHVVASEPAGSTGVDAACRDDRSSPWRGLPVLGSGLVAAWAVGSGSRSRRAYLEQLHARTKDLERERDHRAALAVADERGRISREVHDVVAHGLSLIVVQAQGADAALDNRPADARDALRTIISAGRDSLADMRRVLAALGEVEDTWEAPPGLARLPSLLTRIRQSGTPVRLSTEGVAVALPSTVDLSAYRVVQEALTNVMKHAGAGAAAHVVVRYDDAEVVIEVSDDGKGATGVDAGDGTGTVGGAGAGAPGGSGTGMPTGGGNGLPGMHRRVTLLGGRFSAGRGARGGFVVRAALPIHGQGAWSA
jgi:signal transduction histidine kinase